MIQIFTQKFYSSGFDSCCILDIKSNQITQISNVYLAFYIKPDFVNTISRSKIFDTLTFTYNSEESVLTLDFINIFNQIYTDVTIHPGLTKLFESNPMYIPVNRIFHSKFLWVQFQQISFSIRSQFKLSEICDSIELVYDGIEDNLENYKPLGSIGLHFYSCIQISNPGEEITIETGAGIGSEIMQTINWIYMDSDTNLLDYSLNPVKLISLNYSCGLSIIQPCEPNYFVNINQFNYYSSINTKLYTCSFVTYPMDATNTYGLKYSNVTIKQKLNPLVPISTQWICIRLFKSVPLID